jgi:hypothetical protein
LFGIKVENVDDAEVPEEGKGETCTTNRLEDGE